MYAGFPRALNALELRARVRAAWRPVDWAAAWRSFEGLDVQDRLGTLRVRTLVLAGELDASTSPELMACIAGRVPGAGYQVLPGTPHMQTLERPELVARALNEFLPAEALDRVES